MHAIARARAAAEKRMALLPEEREPHIQMALLHYFSQSLDDAYLELGSVLERVRGAQQASEISRESSTSDSDDRTSSHQEGIDTRLLGEGDAQLLEKGTLLVEKIRLELMFREDRL